MLCRMFIFMTLFMLVVCRSRSREWHHPQYGTSLNDAFDRVYPGENHKAPGKSIRYDDAGIIKFIRHFVRENPDAIDHTITNLIQNVPSYTQPEFEAWECPNPGPSLCPAQQLGADRVPMDSQLVIESIREKWETFSRVLGIESEDCDPCISLMDGIQKLFCEGDSWELIRDVVIVGCELAAEAGGLDPVMCNGTITLQGQHVYCIVMEAEPRHLCESLCNCYPEDTRDRTPVSARTPWAVKAEMTQNGREPKQADGREPKQADRKHTKDGLLMVAQLTDIHIQHKHMIGAPSDCNAYVCCLETTEGTNPAREYGEYSCNLPPRTLDLFIDRVQEANPDFILYAGDSPPHTMWDETLQSQLNCSQLVVSAMEKVFPEGTRVYPNIGNHEMYPTNLFSLRMDETKQMMQEFTKIWHNLAGFDQEANNTMTNMAHYTVTVPDHPKLRIMSINTNYDWYVANFYNTLNENTPENSEHKQWVADTLTAARNNDEKVIIIAHHPVGGSDSNVRSARWWENIAKEFSDVIVLHVSGHTHRDHFKMSFDHETMEAKSVNYVIASTTANTNINPTMRMFYLDPANGYSLVDFESFYLDIKTQNESIGVPPAIAFSYSAMDDYGMTDLSPSSWKQLVFRFIDDDSLFQKYYKNLRSHGITDHCDFNCKADEICNIWFSEMSEVDECIMLATSKPPPSSTTEQISAGTQAPNSLALMILLYCVCKVLGRL